MKRTLFGTLGLAAGGMGAAGLIAALIAGTAAPAAAQSMVQEEDLPLYLFADLSGKNETKAGDPDGYGDFAGVLKFKEKQFCYELSVSGIGTPTAAHIHSGKAGVDGDPVITISVNGSKNQICMDTDAKLLKQIANDPEDFYVNVHTAAKPAGAIRGQLQS